MAFATFVCALARQCFFSSYALVAEDDELREAAQLRISLEREIGVTDALCESIETRLATFALYDSLRALEGHERLLDSWPPRWSLRAARG